MNAGDEARARRGAPGKRAAVARAAVAVFARDGYTRAGIDAIAAEAGVSTRTIYNHFAGKEQLFADVVVESATRVAEALIASVERHFATLEDAGAGWGAAELEADLVALGRAWARPLVDFADHFALVRQINAEAAHFPPALLAAWRDAGPRRAERALAGYMQRLADRGRIEVDDASTAARHFTLLVGGEVTDRSYFGAVPLDERETTRVVRAGVRTFLRGHLPRRPSA